MFLLTIFIALRTCEDIGCDVGTISYCKKNIYNM